MNFLDGCHTKIYIDSFNRPRVDYCRVSGYRVLTKGDTFVGKCYFNVNRLSSYVSRKLFPNLYRVPGVPRARLYFGGKSATR